MTLRAKGQYPVAGKCLHDTLGSPSGPSSPPDQLPAPSPPPAPAMNSRRRDHLGTDRSEPLPVLIIGECCPGAGGGDTLSP